jgi:hypothetical protein
MKIQHYQKRSSRRKRQIQFKIYHLHHHIFLPLRWFQEITRRNKTNCCSIYNTPRPAEQSICFEPAKGKDPSSLICAPSLLSCAFYFHVCRVSRRLWLPRRDSTDLLLLLTTLYTTTHWKRRRAAADGVDDHSMNSRAFNCSEQSYMINDDVYLLQSLDTRTSEHELENVQLFRAVMHDEPTNNERDKNTQSQNCTANQ